MFSSTSYEKQPMPQFMVAVADEQSSDARTMEFPMIQRSRPDDTDVTDWVCERLTECYNH